MAVLLFDRASEVDFGISGDSDNRSLSWIAKVEELAGDQDNVVLDYAESNTPLAHDGMPRTGFDIQQVMPYVYRVTANYSYSEPEASRTADAVNGSAELAFTFGVERKKILYSLETVQAFPTGTDLDQFNNAIGVQGTGDQQTIAGADTLVPIGRRVINFTIPTSVLTQSYENTIEDLTGTVWKPDTAGKKFLNRDEGEVLFLGARGTVTTGDFSTISFEFEVRKNLYFDLAGEIAGVTIPAMTTINAFDKVWVRYVQSKNVDGPTEKATGVFVERVYEWGDFELLAIPNAVTVP